MRLLACLPVCLGGLSSPARRRWWVGLAGAALIAAMGAAVVGEAEEQEDRRATFARLAQRLVDDRFAVRQSAHRRLMELGVQEVAAAFADIEPPPADPYGADRSEYFDRLTERVTRHVEQNFFALLPPCDEVEGQLRLARLRRDITSKIDDRVSSIRARYPEPLPEDQARLVEGYTGGVRADQLWFDASYNNRSRYVITAARIQIRIEHEGRKIDKEILVGQHSKPIPPGASGTWSAEIEPLREGKYDSFWRTLAVYGYPAKK